MSIATGRRDTVSSLLTILTVLIFASCRQRSGHSTASITVSPFELVITSSNYSAAYNIRYELTDKELKIIFRGELEGDKDSTLFRKALAQDTTLSRLSDIQIDNLQESYSNPCVRDGAQLTVKLNKNHKNKTIHLSNYYQADVGRAIALINSLVPEKYRLKYDQAALVKSQEDCNGIPPAE